MLGIFADVFRTATRTEGEAPTHHNQAYHHEARKRDELRRQNDLNWFYARR